MRRTMAAWLSVCAVSSCALAMFTAFSASAGALQSASTDLDHVAALQQNAIDAEKADWGCWGTNPSKYAGWNYHSNRLIPCYVFGGSLDPWQDERSVYRDGGQLKKIYGQLPEETVNPAANYFDQTDLFHLQNEAVKSGKKYIVLMVFDGMDWQTTQAAATVKSGAVRYTGGAGTGLAFQDYAGVARDFGYFVCSSCNTKSDVDVDHQRLLKLGDEFAGGYNAELGGATPWAQPASEDYLIGKYRGLPHHVTDSASSATSMTSGIKTYNAAINVNLEGEQVVPIAQRLQQQGFRIGVVSSVAISHATPGAAYANNVERYDYQDIGRDLVGRPSSSHPDPLPGADVVLGAGWGESKDDDRKNQGQNYEPGNPYLADSDLAAIDLKNGGRYVTALRTAGEPGSDVLQKATQLAIAGDHRLFGFFGVSEGHLPYQTADGRFDPVAGRGKKAEKYSAADVAENPLLADLTRSALDVLWHQGRESGFWLMVEAGDVDWANHDNNIDNSIGAVFSGEAAFSEITKWAEKNNCWDDTLVIVAADHGHLLLLPHPEALVRAPDPRQPAVEDHSGEGSGKFSSNSGQTSGISSGR